MSKRYLLAAAALASIVPTLATAQARPATPAPRPATPPPQQPAARPAAPRPSMGGTAQTKGSIELTIQPTGFILRDAAIADYINTDVVAVGDAPGTIFPGVVGRFGYHLSPKLALGAGIGFGASGGATLLNYNGGITFTLKPDSRMSPLLSLVVGGTSISGDGGPGRVGSATGIGVMGGLGLRRFMSEKVAVRIDLRAGMESFDATPSISAITGQVGAGISYFMGGGPPRDTDIDGVPDKRDACANTTRGATVDARGCPQDTDRDGVYNGLDRCPDTPANTPVDTSGCTRDTDRDGIADNADRCANTPAGTQVDATGCPRDTDGDGVTDAADRCANSPRGQPVDATGCPMDTDRDGVLDPADRCPATAAGTPVDANGCPRDTDTDGVADNSDRCPNTAAGTQVDANGCPVQRDADRDGVVDANDRCPNTATTARVDANGCPLYELPAAMATKVVATVTFAGTTTRPTLTPASRTVLDQVATAIQNTPNSRWEIGVFTDNRGVAATLTRTSQARAQAAVDYLVSKGISASQLTAMGYGSRNPIQPNTTVAGRTANRRVEIKRLQ